jgi:hypothetical protein
MLRIPTILLVFLPLLISAQDVIGFKFGQATYAELDQKTYASDTSAGAFVISESGNAFVDYENPNKLIFQYHVKIKILRHKEASRANIEIRLSKTDTRDETIGRVYASSFNIEDQKIKETKVDAKSIFTEKNRKYDNVVKFAIPNVKTGSVIEYQYQIESPFLWNFRNWEFQDEIPKVRSEYQTTIPGNYKYNITLRGYLKLTAHESGIEKECLRGGNGVTADCAVDKYVMTNIPAFKEEEYMTSKRNFLSSINFELSTVTDWDGAITKYTKEWRDADLDLKNSQKFGLQLKRGKDVVDGYIDAAVIGETDGLQKAKKIYDFIKFHYAWDGVYGDQSELGIKKAFDEKKGNVGDINLTLIAALRYAGFNVDPVLLATRSIGRPVELHPVLSDFNYVIAKLDLDGKSYLLDAVDDFLPFGSIPLSCYNGIGRVVNADGSYWMEIKPTDRDRTVTQIVLKLSDDGMMKGTISEANFGYAAVRKRKDLASYDDEKSYLDKKRATSHFMTITRYERTAGDELDKPVTEKFSIEFNAFDPATETTFLFNPFLVNRVEENPFKGESRIHPIDFAVPQEEVINILVEFPESFEVASIPDKVGLALPDAGGKYIFGGQVMGNKLSMNNSLGIQRTVFMPEEYPYLREMYTRMMQAQNADVIFKKKK